MKESSFSKELRRKNDSLWLTLRNHPFVQGIGDGNLELGKFVFYLKQDFLYLVDFGRILAVAAARSKSAADICFFFELMRTTLEIELESLRQTCSALGIDPRDLEKTEPGLCTVAYASFLLRTCYEGDVNDIVAALLPCEAGYAELGRQLAKKGLPANPHFRKWIESYSSPEFLQVAARCEAHLDLSAQTASLETKRRWHRLYRTSLRFELLFFEMTWRKELWPDTPDFSDQGTETRQ